jgi:hypothetical protein
MRQNRLMTPTRRVVWERSWSCAFGDEAQQFSIDPEADPKSV